MSLEAMKRSVMANVRHANCRSLRSVTKTRIDLSTDSRLSYGSSVRVQVKRNEHRHRVHHVAQCQGASVRLERTTDTSVSSIHARLDQEDAVELRLPKDDLHPRSNWTVVCVRRHVLPPLQSGRPWIHSRCRRPSQFWFPRSGT